MTNELEKQFFQCFGIEPKKECKHFLIGDAYHNNDCDNPNNKCDVCDVLLTIQDRITCPYYERDLDNYPTITDSILLELICILDPYCYSSGENIQHLKESVLGWCITYKEAIKHQVRTLFEEE